tara:strand:- start:499 stop:834 length:336 start_codon:yes stop_codon:yes gene_type:complete
VIANKESGVLELTDCEIQLREMVDGYAANVRSQKLEAEEAGEYSVKYTIDRDGRYISVALMLAGGGPVIWLDTGDQEITGYWGADKYKALIYPDEYDYLDDYWQEQYKCLS